MFSFLANCKISFHGLLSWKEIPFVVSWYNNEGEFDFDYFVCGHTISDNIKDDHFSIDYIRDTIDVDCGAKVLGYTYFDEEKYARLAALRLDDFKEFYER